MSAQNNERRPGEDEAASEKAGGPGQQGSPRLWLRHDVTQFNVPGVGLVAAVLPVAPDNAPPVVREGVVRRRLVIIRGECPCGARRALPNREQRRQMARDRRVATTAWQLTVPHESDCPAVDEVLMAAGARW